MSDENRFRFRIQVYDNKAHLYRDLVSFFGAGPIDPKRLTMSPECAEGRHLACQRINEVDVSIAILRVGKFDFYARGKCRYPCHEDKAEDSRIL